MGCGFSSVGIGRLKSAEDQTFKFGNDRRPEITVNAQIWLWENSHKELMFAPADPVTLNRQYEPLVVPLDSYIAWLSPRHAIRNVIGSQFRILYVAKRVVRTL